MIAEHSLVGRDAEPPSKELASAERSGVRFTLKYLLISLAVLAVVFAIWAGYFRKVVTVRAATANDPVRESYFGFDNDNAEARNIVVVKGGFTKGTWLSASLAAVQNGEITIINEFTVGRSSNRIGSLPKETLTIYLALGEWESPHGRVTQLGSVGQTRGGGANSDVSVSIPNRFSDCFVGTMVPGRSYLIYVEGDTLIQLDSNLTIEEFAEKHAGNYFVVIAQLK
jgi:hypothetical protein